MKTFMSLPTLFLIFLYLLLVLGKSVAAGYRFPITTTVASVIKRNVGTRALPATRSGENNSPIHPAGLPTFDVQIREVERCWGDIATFTITSINGQPNAPVPDGIRFVLFEDDPKNELASSSNLNIDLTMPKNAQANIPMSYILIITDNQGNYGMKMEVFVTWHYIDNKINIDAGYSGAAPYLQNYPIQFVAESGNDVYVWTWGDGTTDTFNGINTAVHSYPNSGTYNISVSITKYCKVPSGQCATTGSLYGFRIVVPLCEIPVSGNGQFRQNTRSGAISYVPTTANCQPAASLECLSEAISTEHVVAATATAFTDQLPADLPYGLTATNPYLAGQWRTTPQASYSFRTGLKVDSRNYSAGTFTLQPFDWGSSMRARPAAWLTAAVTERVSANGDVLQERDPLGIPSAAKFSYGATLAGVPCQVLPYLQAHNAEYATVFFESFENARTTNGVTMGEDGFLLRGNVAVNGFIPGVNVSIITCTDQTTTCSAYAHTGNSCALVTEHRLNLMRIPQTIQLNAGELLIKAWVRYQLPDNRPVYMTDAVAQGNSIQLARWQPQTGTSTPIVLGGNAIAFSPIAQTGEWILYEGRISMNVLGLAVGESLIPTLWFASGTALVDDIRVQPADAQMTTYVYDPVSLRLVASFDDQHFALRYQYNAEGKLIRKQADTERGLKTLQETHYHTPTTTQVDE